MNFTFFKSVSQVKGTRADVSLSSIAKHRIVNNKEDAPLFSCYLSSDDTAKKSSIECFTALSYDIDESGPKARQIASVVASAFRGVTYTTFNHTPSDPRYRVVIALREPITDAKVYMKLKRDVANYLCAGSNKKRPILDGTLGPAVKNYIASCSSDNLKSAITIEHDSDMYPAIDYNWALMSKIRRWLHFGMPKVLKDDDERLEMFTAIREGNPFALPGNRHNSALKITASLASRFDPLTDDELLIIMAPALAGIDDDFDIHTELLGPYRTALDKIDAGEWERGMKEHGSRTINHVSSSSHTSIQDDITIVRHGDKYYTRVDGTNVFDVCSKGNILGTLPKLQPRMQFMTRDGPLPINKILQKHCDLATDIVYTAFQKEPSLENNTLNIPVYSLRKDLKAEHSPEVHAWLCCLCNNNQKIIAHFMRWLAVFPDLSKPLPALYLVGKSGSAKSLLAMGLNRLWSKQQPASLNTTLFDNFQDRATETPLLWADEGLHAKTRTQSELATQKIKELVTMTFRAFNQKNKPMASLNSATRMIVCGNNNKAMSFAGAHTSDDIQSIASRFFYRKLDNQAFDHMEKRTLDRVPRWHDDAIANHVLWVSEQIGIDDISEGRLWVNGTAEPMRSILFDNAGNSLICEWVLTVRRKDSAANFNRTGIDIGVDHTKVQLTAVHATWTLVHQDVSKKPTMNTIRSMLQSVCKDDEPDEYGYWHIDMELFRGWAKRMGVNANEANLKVVK